MKRNFNMLNSLKNVASLLSPKAKAVIYTMATIFLFVLIITSAILAYIAVNYDNVDHTKIIGILTILKGVCLTIQQAFNGDNIKKLKQKQEAKKNGGTN